MPVLDYLRMRWFMLQRKVDNKRFLIEHPDVKIPPDSILYETYKLDYRQYYNDGFMVAKQMVERFHRHQHRDLVKVLDWGCGPARVVRHLPALLSSDQEIHATDFNAKTIDWCRRNIEKIHFHLNSQAPPTNLPKGFFDLIYGISVLTHLSVELQMKWLEELHRLLAEKGIVILTTQGEAFRRKLDRQEVATFDSGAPVIRTGGKEGRRTFSSFHPLPYLQELFSDFRILEHQPGNAYGKFIEQDLWVLGRRI